MYVKEEVKKFHIPRAGKIIQKVQFLQNVYILNRFKLWGKVTAPSSVFYGDFFSLIIWKFSTIWSLLKCLILQPHHPGKMDILWHPVEELYYLSVGHPATRLHLDRQTIISDLWQGQIHRNMLATVH